MIELLGVQDVARNAALEVLNKSDMDEATQDLIATAIAAALGAYIDLLDDERRTRYD